jgi:hypothetical protein
MTFLFDSIRSLYSNDENEKPSPLSGIGDGFLKGGEYRGNPPNLEWNVLGIFTQQFRKTGVLVPISKNFRSRVILLRAFRNPLV